MCPYSHRKSLYTLYLAGSSLHCGCCQNNAEIGLCSKTSLTIHAWSVYTRGILQAHKNKSISDAFQYFVNTLHELTDIHNINFYRFRIGFSQCIGGHHCDVVYDPNRRVSLIKITGIVSRLMIIRTFKDFQRTEKVLDSLKV